MKANNTLHTYLKPLAGIATLAVALPAFAIENPAAEDAPKQKAAAGEAPKEEAQPTRKIAMIGLAGAPTSETLSQHLGLERGNGLTVYRVVPGSAADKAGLRVHDVLTELDGKKIGSQQDLREAVTAHKPGDEVTVKFIHHGKAAEKQVVLGARGKDFPMMRGAAPWFQGMDDIPDADIRRIQEETRKHIDQIRRQLEQQRGMQMNLQKMLENMIPQGDAIPNRQAEPQRAQRKMKSDFFNISSEVSAADDQGSAIMKTRNGKKEVIVKDKAGKVLYEGPYDTEQDKAAVPDDIRDRLKELGIGENGKSGFRLRIQRGGMFADPAAPDDAEE